MHHYTGCGLPGVWLRNGFTVKETAYGPAVAIGDVEGLHRAIGLYLTRDRPRLTSAEARFLRKELDLPQAQLASILGVGETTVRGWESGRARVPAPAERLLRVLYLESVAEGSAVSDLLKRLAQLNRDRHAGKIEFEETPSGWAAAA
jgi:DNA-binding transcriptional regulator YiaG